MELRVCLAWSLRERMDRDVYVASARYRRVDVVENPRFRKLQTLKRPEGRAPAQILIGVRNAYRTAGGFS